MSNIVIKAEGIGKSYLIGHQSNERYATLRDVIANTVKGLWSKIRGSQGHVRKDIVEKFFEVDNLYESA